MSAPASARGRCPTCGAPREAKHRPFCSARCKDVDLHRWLKGAYAIPAVEADDVGGEEDGPERSGQAH